MTTSLVRARTRAAALLTAGGILAGTARPAGTAAVLAGAAAAACAVALLALLAVLRVRGRPVTEWLLPPFPGTAAELVTVARIVQVKHRYLSAATYSLTVAVLAGAAAVTAAAGAR